MEKMVNLSESTKNTILTVEGILLLLCVIVPSAALLFEVSIFLHHVKSLTYKAHLKETISKCCLSIIAIIPENIAICETVLKVFLLQSSK